MAQFKSIQVHDRVLKGDRMWIVTGVHMGAVDQENLVTLRPLDRKVGTAYGRTIEECTVPEDLIDHDCIFRMVDHQKPAQVCFKVYSADGEGDVARKA